jgi:hypothetical protein
MAERWKRRPEGSTWGDFGPDDRIGRLNLLTPETVRRAVAEVREGAVFCLSLPLDYPGGSVLAPHRHPPRLAATERRGRPFFNYRFGDEQPGACDIGCDDAVLLCTQYSTQWDSLAHIGEAFDADGDGEAELVYYNGFRAGAEPGEAGERGPREAAPLGIEHMAAAGVQGRGVMIDLEAHFGRARRLVGYDDLMRVMEEDRVTVEPADFLCLHTGFARLVLDMARQPDGEALRRACAVLDGADERLLRWIGDSGVVAICADNYAVEAIPSRSRTAYVPLHAHCLFKLGVHLGELWYLSELSAWLRARGRSRFLLTAPPLRLPGAVGSPVTPVATA